MPTSKQETEYIASILDFHLEDVKNQYEDKALTIQRRLTQDLAEKIGFLTVNYSVRKSLFDLCKHYNKNWKIPDEIICANIELYKLDTEHHSVPIHEYIGLDLEEWDEYVRQNSSIY